MSELVVIVVYGCVVVFFFFKQKTAYEMRISDWSSDVCSSDLSTAGGKWGSTRRSAAFSTFLTPRCAVTYFRTARSSTSSGGIGSRKIGRASCRERVCQYV